MSSFYSAWYHLRIWYVRERCNAPKLDETALFSSSSSTFAYYTTKNDMSCKNVNPRFTFLYLVAFSQGQQETKKKAIVSISSTKQQRDDDSSRTICTKNLFWSLSLSKSCKDLERIVIYICEWRFVAVHSLSWALSRRHKNDSLSYAWWTEKPTLVHNLFLFEVFILMSFTLNSYCNDQNTSNSEMNH